MSQSMGLLFFLYFSPGVELRNVLPLRYILTTFYFETGSDQVAQAGLELAFLLLSL